MRQHRLQRLDGHFDHIILWRTRREVLQSQSRLDRPLHHGTLAASGEAYELIRYAGYDRQQQYAARYAQPEIRPAEEREYEYRHQHDDEQEIRAAARMQARELLHIRHRQRQPGLVAVDGLVLGTMILEHAADVRHARYAPDIAEEYDEAQDALHEIQPHRIIGDRAEQMRGPRRYGYEQHTGQHECEYDGQHHLFVAELLILITSHLGRV